MKISNIELAKRIVHELRNREYYKSISLSEILDHLNHIREDESEPINWNYTITFFKQYYKA